MVEVGPVGQPAPKVTTLVEEPYKGSMAISFTAQQALQGVQTAAQELAHEAHRTGRAEAGVRQLQESWNNWLEDPTQETLQPVLADLNDLQKVSPRLHQEVMSFFEPADEEINAYLDGRTTLGEVNATFIGLKTDPDRTHQWGRGITEALSLESTSLQGAVSGLSGAIGALHAVAQLASRATSAQRLT